MSTSEHHAQLDWEARAGRPAAAAAYGSALASLAAVIVQATAFQDAADGDRGALIAIDDKGGQLWFAVGLRNLSFVLLGVALYYLYRVIRYRHPLPGMVAPLIPLGPLLLVVGSILGQLDVFSLASDFTESGVTEGRPGEQRAEDLLDDRAVPGPAVVAGGTLALALTLVLINLNGMRAGIFSRFMGIMGIIAGALLVLPLAPLPIIQIFWLGALGALFLGRWPGGRGPAWETGETVPWPSAAQLREERVGAAVRGEPEADGSDAGAEEQEPQAIAKRKRKRRR